MATSERVSFQTVGPDAHIKKEDIDNASPKESKTLTHKLVVQSEDGKIKNLLCPIELVLEATNFSAPLIPVKYEPEMFYLFHNVTPNSYKASTPRTSSRKRKNDKNYPRSSKKRKKMATAKPHYDEDDELQQQINTHAPADDMFSFQPHLNVNSRPKRLRKKVSYIEPEPNQIPIIYVPPKTSNNNSNAKINKQPLSKPPQSQIMPQIQNVVEMRWVQCDKCVKWRRIPMSVSDKELEGAWTCAMNKWDLKRNSCSAEEEPYDLSEEQTMKVSNGSNSSQKEKRNEFYSNLQAFYETPQMISKHLNTTQLDCAKIGPKTVDFLQLYLEVTKRGGYQYCMSANLWDQIFASLSCFQAQFTQQAHLSLQNLYKAYLWDYERMHFASKQTSNQPFVARHAIQNTELQYDDDDDEDEDEDDDVRSQPNLNSNF